MDLVTGAIAHLKATVPLLLNRVEGTSELEDAIASTKFQAPAAFVLTLGESAEEDQNATSVISQRVTLTFGVVLAVDNGTKAFGVSVSNGGDKLAALRKEVMDSMLGWQLSAEYDPTTFVRGRLVDLQNRVRWWQDEYKTTFYLRKLIGG